VKVIRELFYRHDGTYGSPRITLDLWEMGWKVSKNTVAKIMAEQGLAARPKRRRRGLTKADQKARKPPDLVGRRFAAPPAPDRVWVGDLTEIPTDEGKLYLATILDLYARRAVGWALGTCHDDDLAKAALQVAIATRGGHVDGVVFHSDQGGEYTGQTFVNACGDHGVRQSMGRVGSALDNAVAESFNSTLQFELLSKYHFRTRRQARDAVARFMDRYNHIRRHTSAGGIAPIARETQFHTRPGQAALPRRPPGRPHNGDGSAATITRKKNNHTIEAATPPQAFLGTSRGLGAAHCAGPPLPGQGPLRGRCAAALRAVLDRGASTAPPDRKTRAGKGPARHNRRGTPNPPTSNNRRG